MKQGIEQKILFLLPGQKYSFFYQEEKYTLEIAAEIGGHFLNLWKDGMTPQRVARVKLPEGKLTAEAIQTLKQMKCFQGKSLQEIMGEVRFP